MANFLFKENILRYHYVQYFKTSVLLFFDFNNNNLHLKKNQVWLSFRFWKFVFVPCESWLSIVNGWMVSLKCFCLLLADIQIVIIGEIILGSKLDFL